MTDEKYIAVGKLGKPHALSGAFRFQLLLLLKSSKKTPAHFMLETEGNYLPHFIKKLEWTGAGEGIIYFEEITSPEKAKKYTGAMLYLPEKTALQFFEPEVDETGYLKGYLAMAGTDETIGVIQDVTKAGEQTLLLVNKNGKEVIIPFVGEFVVKINKRKKEIIFDLPEGLLEL